MSEGRGRRGTTAPLRSIDAAPVRADSRGPGGQVALAKASSTCAVRPPRSNAVRIVAHYETTARFGGAYEACRMCRSCSIRTSVRRYVQTSQTGSVLVGGAEESSLQV